MTLFKDSNYVPPGSADPKLSARTEALTPMQQLWYKRIVEDYSQSQADATFFPQIKSSHMAKVTE